MLEVRHPVRGLVVKADVAGSLEALEDEIAKLPQQEVQVNIIHRGVGGINESDVMLAAASDGVVLAFNVRPVGDARQIADREGVIRSYAVIYRAIEELRAAMQGMLEPAELSRRRSDRPRCASCSKRRGRHHGGLVRHRGQSDARRPGCASCATVR